MKNLIRISIFALALLLLFGCKQSTKKKQEERKDEKKTFQILFEDPQFATLTATRSDGSSFTSGQMALENEELVFTVVPNGEYRVKKWEGATEDTNNPNMARLVVKQDTTVSVTMKGKEFKVTYSVQGEHGSLTATYAGNNIKSGKSVERGAVIFEATPDNGYKVGEWIWEGGEKKFGGYPGAKTLILFVSSDSDVKVTFKQK